MSRIISLLQTCTIGDASMNKHQTILPILSATLVLAISAVPANGVAQTAPAAPPGEQVCLAIGVSHGTIFVDDGGQRIELALVGGPSSGPCSSGPSGIESLLVSYSEKPDAGSDVVLSEDCPSFEAQIDALWSKKAIHLRLDDLPSEVEIGPFAVSDTDDLFDLDSSSGRRGADRWIRETLGAVRSCWNTVRADTSYSVVDDLYQRLSIKLPTATASDAL